MDFAVTRTSSGAAANYLITGPGWSENVPTGMKHAPAGLSANSAATLAASP